jgi:hypothetical protein
MLSQAQPVTRRGHMSSEAVTYRSERLAGLSEVLGSRQNASEIPSDLFDPVQHAIDTSEASTNAVDEIAGISDEALGEQVSQRKNEERLALSIRRPTDLVCNVACNILRSEEEANYLAQKVFIFIFHQAELFNMTRDKVRSGISQLTHHRALYLRLPLNTRHLRFQMGALREARRSFIEFCGNPPSIAGENCANTDHNQRCISNISDYTVANIVKIKLELPPQGCSRSGVL